jgi:hypothetical protein
MPIFFEKLLFAYTSRDSTVLLRIHDSIAAIGFVDIINQEIINLGCERDSLVDHADLAPVIVKHKGNR